MKTLAAALEQAMRSRGIATIRDLAGTIGISEVAARDVLTNRRHPYPKTLTKIARFLRLPQDQVRAMADYSGALPVTTSRRARGAKLGERDRADAVDSAVRTIQDAALAVLLKAIPLPLIETLRQLTASELEDIHRQATILLQARTSAALERLSPSDLERRARRFKRQQLEPSRTRK